MQPCSNYPSKLDLLGIHPHNAMLDYQAGKPWPGVDYVKVEEIQRIIHEEFFTASRTASEFYHNGMQQIWKQS